MHGTYRAFGLAGGTVNVTEPSPASSKPPVSEESSSLETAKKRPLGPIPQEVSVGYVLCLQTRWTETFLSRGPCSSPPNPH